MATKAEINYDSSTSLLVVNFTGTPSENQKQRIFLVPSSDYGDFSKHRKSSAYEDYLKVLREESLTIVRMTDFKSYTFKFGEGDNYSNGFPVELKDDLSPKTLADGESVRFHVFYSGNTPLRIEFEVF